MSLPWVFVCVNMKMRNGFGNVGVWKTQRPRSVWRPSTLTETYNEKPRQGREEFAHKKNVFLKNLKMQALDYKNKLNAHNHISNNTFQKKHLNIL